MTSTVIKLSYCATETKSAKFVATDESSNHDTTLLAFEPVPSRIVDGVSGHSKSFWFNNQNIVYSI